MADGRTKAWVVASLLLVGTAAGGEHVPGDLQEVRQRLRAEAGVRDVPQRDADLPLVPLTVLPGDTHARLALDLTGSRKAEGVLREVAPRLTPGQRLHVPRALLTPRLADPRLEPLTLGEPHPTLWSLAKDATVVDARGVPAAVRNLQRLNAIGDPGKLPPRATILVPRSLLLAATPEPLPTLRIRTDFRVTDLRGLARQPRAGEFPVGLRHALEREGQWAQQLTARTADLVVIHTTEHRGAPFANVARYVQRRRLAHYLIGPNGVVYEVVPEASRAYGSGQSLWEGRYVVDHEAINVEIYADTDPTGPRTGIAAVQYDGLRALLAHLRSRRPDIHDGRVVTHRMVAVNYESRMRSRKGDPFEFDWARAGLPDNSLLIDQDVLLGRAKTCTDERYADRVTAGQTAASRLLGSL